MRRHLIVSALLLGLIAAPARPAFADLTAFVGLSPTPERRAARGVAFGFGLLIIGFEFEYSTVIEDVTQGLTGLATGSGNVLLQTPGEVGGVQLYATTGGGVFRERLAAVQETSVATNAGAGAKIRLAGPLRLRLDYRVFRLQGNPIHQTYQRFYAGANLAF
ncbi:MAG: hypothetical protein AB1635_02845 [Acidobacteriota bacterium]